MHLFCLENLASHEVKPYDPTALSAFSNPRPKGQSKETFRSWCTDASTKSLFFSVWSGADERIRVSNANPAYKLHGIVGDFDSEAAYGRLKDMPKAVGLLPMYVTKTFSEGKARLVWVFERPIVINNEELLKRFLRALNARIKFSKALPGYDSASVDPAQYFEVGSDWAEVEGGKPISSSVLEHAMVEAAEKVVLNTEDLPIPINLIADQVADKFPGRWNKPFEVGQRGPLFWVADGIDREGALVTETGMVCFSDRAGSNFMSWRQIFGDAFVCDFEDKLIGQASLTFWFDGRNYYRKLGDRWSPIQKDDARLQLKVMGVSDIRRKGQSVTDLERVLSHIQLNRRIAGAAPICYCEEDIVQINGQSILNLGGLRAMQPAPEGEGLPEKFPWIHYWIENAFDEGIVGRSAKDTFLGWFYWFYKSALMNNPQSGQVMLLVGPASAGKTLFNKWVLGKAMGGEFDAEGILMKKDQFNKNAANVAHWRIDDPQFTGSQADKRAFTQALKKYAANPTILFQPKFHDAQEIPHKGRVCVTLNDDPESSTAIPTTDNSVADKMNLMLLRHDFHPHFFPIESDNENRILQELPYFLRWLIDVWGKDGLPAHITDPRKPRFGVVAYHHPILVQKSHAETPEYALQELLEMWAIMKSKEDAPKDTYTASDLLYELRGVMPDAARDIRANVFGRTLTKLIGHYPRLISKTMSGGLAYYKFKF